MSSADSAITGKQRKLFDSASRAGVGLGYSIIAIVYAAIFIISLVTLGLILIRQANVVNFNDLVATLEQRDRARDGLPEILVSLRKQRDEYSNTLSKLIACAQSDNADPPGRDRATAAQPATPAGASPPITCDDMQKTVRHQAVEMQFNESNMIYKLANLEWYYMSYTDGMTQKMPHIIPALRFLDSGNGWINAWARSPFELMQMFLLVCMGMLGGMIKATDWLVKQSTSNTRPPSLLAYFYKPALGGVIALGGFVIFKATELIIVGPTPNSTTAVAASVFLLAGLGLVSGFGADKALRQIENAANRLFAAGAATPSPTAATPRPL